MMEIKKILLTLLFLSKKLNIMNKKLLLSFAGATLCAIAGTQSANADIPMAYYSSLDGKCGQDLKTAIYNLVSNNVKMLSYGSGNNATWWGFYVTDYQMDGSQRQVIDRYSNDIRYFGSRGSSVSGMNIEHSFPKSWWGGSSNNAYKDLYNLMPCESKINSSKSNYAMGVVTTVSTTNGCTKIGKGTAGSSTKNLWEPADKWKGEFARGYMYMATAYQNFSWTGEGLTSLQQGAYPTLQKWAYTLYLEWARQDPVNQMEIDRNNAVAQIQGNRNPFVDFPNLMEYVWGDSIATPLNLATTVKAGQTTGGGSDIPVSVSLYNKTFTGEDGGCTSAGTSGIWTRSNQYGWVGTGFISGARREADATLLTPEIDLTGYDKATAVFDHTVNKINGGTVSDYLDVSVVVDGGVPQSLGNQVKWPAGNNWVFISSGDIDLSPYVGHKVQLEFRYTSTTAIACSWEIKTLKVTAEKSAAVNDIFVDDNQTDDDAAAEYYSLDGRRINPETASGIVIVRRGNSVRKMIIK